MNKTLLSRAVFFFFTFLAVHAGATPILLDFEGVGHLASIDSFYNGGTDSFGNSGTNYGVVFSDAVGVIDAEAGGTGNFANEPSPDTTMSFQAGAAILNFAAGFDTGISFFYTAFRAGLVTVYDGLDGTGNLLASIDLLAQAYDNCTGDPTGDFCNWTAAGAGFSGTAKSVVFGGEPEGTGFDNVVLGIATPSGQVPTGSTFALVGIGILGLFLSLYQTLNRRSTGV